MDSWEDDDFTPPTLVPPKVTQSWDDEEEEEDEEAAKPTQPTEKQLEQARKAREAEAMRIAAAHEAAQQEAETAEERRLRERRRVEESDHALTEDLFGGGGTAEAAEAPAQAGVEGIPLKTTQDHVKLALDLGEKLSKDGSSGSSGNILALLKELITRVEGKLSLEETNQLALHLNKFKDAKMVAEQKRQAILKKQKAAAAKRNAEKSKKKQHADLFGGAYDGVGDQYDELATNYEDAYDDFM
ncbi:eukaryotic translation initiation factor 3 subunit J [Tribonema minus]|uniref:Eukaryotic translation initiation factor 3 subunit J n=1 Tax=Tribonema minus TaxID=303371 RepID=A0A836CNA4_9STRA|nr:eukaryotic translation initiation factor 3 subunit J [Tribonema minus]